MYRTDQKKKKKKKRRMKNQMRNSNESENQNTFKREDFIFMSTSNFSNVTHKLHVN